MNLTTLPLSPLEAIASNLDFSSLVSLAKTNTNLAFLQPKEQHVVGQDFSVSGPYDGPDQTYFDVEVLTRGLVAIKMVWEWKDQVQRFFHFSLSVALLGQKFSFSGLGKPKGPVVAPASEGRPGL